MYSTYNNLQIKLLPACLYFSSHNIFYDNTTVPKTLNYQIIRIMVSAYSRFFTLYAYVFFNNISEPEKHISKILYMR